MKDVETPEAQSAGKIRHFEHWQRHLIGRGGRTLYPTVHNGHNNQLAGDPNIRPFPIAGTPPSPECPSHPQLEGLPCHMGESDYPRVLPGILAHLPGGLAFATAATAMAGNGRQHRQL